MSVEVEFGSGAGVREFIGRVGKVPAAVDRNMRPKLRSAGELVRGDAAARASWSTRIPAALAVRTNLTTGRGGGVRVIARARAAPHARPYEGIDGAGQFRHPLFGDDEHWYPQATRPFLAPAARANRAAVTRLAGEAVQQAYRDLSLT